MDTIYTYRTLAFIIVSKSICEVEYGASVIGVTTVQPRFVDFLVSQNHVQAVCVSVVLQSRTELVNYIQVIASLSRYEGYAMHYMDNAV